VRHFELLHAPDAGFPRWRVANRASQPEVCYDSLEALAAAGDPHQRLAAVRLVPAALLAGDHQRSCAGLGAAIGTTPADLAASAAAAAAALEREHAGGAIGHAQTQGQHAGLPVGAGPAAAVASTLAGTAGAAAPRAATSVRAAAGGVKFKFATQMSKAHSARNG
jgi:hypothetical protein